MTVSSADFSAGFSVTVSSADFSVVDFSAIVVLSVTLSSGLVDFSVAASSVNFSGGVSIEDSSLGFSVAVSVSSVNFSVDDSSTCLSVASSLLAGSVDFFDSSVNFSAVVSSINFSCGFSLEVSSGGFSPSGDPPPAGFSVAGGSDTFSSMDGCSAETVAVCTSSAAFSVVFFSVVTLLFSVSVEGC